MESDIDLRVYLRILRRGWLTIFICVTLFALGAGMLAKLAPDTYEADVLIYLTQPDFQFSLEDAATVYFPLGLLPTEVSSGMSTCGRSISE